MDCLDKLIGARINIHRTDGRVHPALVATVNNDKKTVSVEWIEHGETRGKEADLSAVISLNPNIFTLNVPQANAIETSSSTSNIAQSENRLCRSSSKSAIPINKARISSRIIRAENNIGEAHVSNANNTTEPFDTTQLPDSNRSVNRYSTSQSTQCLKKSVVVKQVEKLKKNREERRLKQAEEKAEKDAFLQQAPGNPHWELLHMIQNFRNNLEIQPLTESDIVEDHLITVCVRKRPLNKKEINRKEVDVITVPVKNQIIVHEPKTKVDLTKYLENQTFRFDYALDQNSTNEMVYRYTAQPLVKTIFEGGFATCFAYGQTGSGKTHTMGGDFNGKTQDCTKGIYALSVTDVFTLIQSEKYHHLNLTVSISFFEIYSGKVFDLLNNKAKLRILEDGRQIVQVVGLTEKVVVTTAQVLKLLQLGNLARTSGTTAVNSNSSRSHAVFQIILRTKKQKIHGKFSLIDLAGNERGADTCSADRQTRMEGAEINKSLLALKECIRALGKKGSHLPFRVSKLTQVLRDSFVGAKSRTCMIAMVSPGVSSCENSLNTLRYADRVKELGVAEPNVSTKQEVDSPRDTVSTSPGTDLFQLQTLNEIDMPPEMYNFHQVISELQLAEEDMIENHKYLVEYLKDVATKAEKLLCTTNEVTYDQEHYCHSWFDLIETTLTNFMQSKDIVMEFNSKMIAEEQLSRKNSKFQ